MQRKPRKIVLAYSGGLDTSVILRWLQNEYDCEIISYTADVGQGNDEVETARARALALGLKPENIIVEDLRDELVRAYAMPVFRANAVYEGSYLMGTPIARPLVAKRQIEIAEAFGADAVAHGATGKGNDQLRFELAYYALRPEINVIAPWRLWQLRGRSDLVAYAREHGVDLGLSCQQEPPYSADSNIIHISAEGRSLEDPWITPDENVFTRTISPKDAPNVATTLEIDFEEGDPVAIDGVRLAPAQFLERLNALGGENGVGRIDIVDTRYVGIKSRGIFETPGGTIWQIAHRALESITLDRGESHLKDELMPKYAELVYNGFWFSPERRMLQALVDQSQKWVTGSVRLELYKGNVTVLGRKSPYTLYSKRHVTFEHDDIYDQAHATGFIGINALRLRILATARGIVG